MSVRLPLIRFGQKICSITRCYARRVPRLLSKDHPCNSRPHQSICIGYRYIPSHPYSPELASRDCHLFLAVKSHLGETNYRIGAVLNVEVVQYLRATMEIIRKIVHRMQKCIDRNGNYVEKYEGRPYIHACRTRNK